MERLTTPIRGLRQRPGTPPPAGSEASEDGGQRYLEATSEAMLSDKYPAGCSLYATETEPDTHSNAGRDRSEGGAKNPALPAEQRHDSQVNTGRGAAQLAGADEAPVEPRTSGRLEVSLDVRLSAVDREAIRRRSRVLGVKPSSWARAVILDALDARSAEVQAMESCAGGKDRAPNASGPAVEQLRRVGVNLNQALRKNAVVDDDLLREVMTAVDSVRASLGDRTRT